jgi:phosphate transport system permease protein
LILYIVIRGVPNLRADMFQLEYTPENQSMIPSLINTGIMILVTLAMSLPVGIGAAVYLTEYSKQDSKFVQIIRITTETLSGIPSIVFGLVGFLVFVIALGWQYSLIAGAMTLALMVLPLIIRTTEEALLGVPMSYREASFGLGAGKVRTIFRVILPAAVPGILAGVILSIGRIAGETAALIFTAGTVAQVPDSIFDSTRTLSVHMYSLICEGLHMDAAYATAFVLLVLVIVINLLSTLVARKISKY